MKDDGSMVHILYSDLRWIGAPRLQDLVVSKSHHNKSPRVSIQRRFNLLSPRVISRSTVDINSVLREFSTLNNYATQILWSTTPPDYDIWRHTSSVINSHDGIQPLGLRKSSTSTTYALNPPDHGIHCYVSPPVSP